MPGLLGIRLIPQHGFERRDRFVILAFAIVDQADIETDSRNLRSQLLGGVEFVERALPFLLAHVDHAEIGVRAHIARRHRHDF